MDEIGTCHQGNRRPGSICLRVVRGNGMLHTHPAGALAVNLLNHDAPAALSRQIGTR